MDRVYTARVLCYKKCFPCVTRGYLKSNRVKLRVKIREPLREAEENAVKIADYHYYSFKITRITTKYTINVSAACSDGQICELYNTA